MANTTDIEFGNIDNEKAVAVEIKHDDKMREDSVACIQVLHLLFLLMPNINAHYILINAHLISPPLGCFVVHYSNW